MLCLLVLAAVGLSAHGARRWAVATQALQDRLEAGRIDDQRKADGPPTRYDPRELEGLPAPVQRYFRAVLADGQPIAPPSRSTLPAASTCRPPASSGSHSRRGSVSSRAAPGFLWNARISMLPGVTVRVVDSYIVGSGLLHAAVQGLVTMADLRTHAFNGRAPPVSALVSWPKRVLAAASNLTRYLSRSSDVWNGRMRSVMPFEPMRRRLGRVSPRSLCRRSNDSIALLTGPPQV